MGKRLIGKAVAARADVQAAARGATLVIVAGTTNACVAEEVLSSLGLGAGFSPRGFRRGAVFPPNFNASSVKADFPGDVIISKGKLIEGKQIYDVSGDLKAGDVFIKGANAVDLSRRRAAVLIGHPACGTAGALLGGVVGRRVKLIVPVGVEKRVDGDVADIAEALNAPTTQGPRMLVLPGEVLTELDAIAALSGASARLVAGGGVCGAEGAAWIGVSGDADQLARAEKLINAVAGEGPYRP
jgi:hypothetical protein